MNAPPWEGLTAHRGGKYCQFYEAVYGSKRNVSKKSNPYYVVVLSLYR